MPCLGLSVIWSNFHGWLTLLYMAESYTSAPHALFLLGWVHWSWGGIITILGLLKRGRTGDSKSVIAPNAPNNRLIYSHLKLGNITAFLWEVASHDWSRPIRWDHPPATAYLLDKQHLGRWEDSRRRGLSSAHPYTLTWCEHLDGHIRNEEGSGIIYRGAMVSDRDKQRHCTSSEFGQC